MILPDANVWFSLATTGHSSHGSSMAWLATVPATEGLAFCRVTHFCRVTQLTLLRLLTTPAIMRDEALTQREAWEQYEKLRQNPGIVLIDEPTGISSAFKNLSLRDEVSPKRWPDDYLAAFATRSGFQLVTYDRTLAARVQGALLLTP